ncbi:MAG: 50S ribosomal protein L6 [Clostridiaceae bacterium]|nr:50S ribosomal protein L6 [Clostridiaceae bacterium]
MSRIGKKPITIPAGVTVKVENGLVSVSNGKEELSQEISPLIDVKIEDGVIELVRSNEEKETKSLHGLYRALINNMVQGLTTGFTKNLEVNGIGYRAAMQGKKLVMSLGYSHPIELEIPEGITVEVPANNKITVKGADKQMVGEIAAKIRAFRVPDAYHGKGIKYDTEVLRLKEGKTGAKAK